MKRGECITTAGHKLEINGTEYEKEYSQVLSNRMNGTYFYCNIDLYYSKSIIIWRSCNCASC